jgi:hypothetical protein
LSDNFAAAGEAALAHLNAAPAEIPATEAPTTEAPVTTDTAAAAPTTQVDQAAQQAAAQVFKVKANGQELEVPLDELLNGYSRHSDYTKKAMELADQRKQFEASVQAARDREAAITAFLRDPNQIANYFQQLTGQQIQILQQQAAAQADPNEIATLGQTEQLLKQTQERLQAQVKEVKEYTEAQLQQIHAAEQAKRAAAIDSDITSTIKSVLEDERFKILNAIDDVGEVLCADAMRLNPTSIDEAKAAILQVAQARAEKLNAHYKEMLKQSAVSQTKLTQGIEPPGGTGITPQPTKHKLGSKELQSAATEWLQARLAK